MGSEYIGPFPERAAQYGSVPRSTPVPAPQGNNPSSPPGDDDTQPVRAIRPGKRRLEPLQEPAYREHVSGSLFVPPSEAPNFRPAYPPYRPYQPPQQAAQPGWRTQFPQTNQGYQQQQQQGQPYYPGYQQPYAGYGGPYPQQYAPSAAYPGYAPYYGYYGYPSPYPYPYPLRPARPHRDGYLYGMSIASFTGSILALLVGFIDIVILLLLVTLPTSQQLSESVKFQSVVQYTAFAAAAFLGGGFGLYHSIRSLFLKKPSAAFKLPWFWLFLIVYLVVIGVGIALHNTGQSVSNEPLTVFLIALAGIAPALTFLALGLRRIHFPRGAVWPTSWRRFALALISGSTMAIALAAIIELILTLILAVGLRLSIFSLDNPESLLHSAGGVAFVLLLASVIAPLVEETVKPLAVVIMIGRIRSAAEAFVLGMACGVGFDLIETSGYIGMGYRNWLDVAIERSSAGLLHGFGAAMVALGWYYVTHPKSSQKRFLLASGCWGYALLQHALWNGSLVLQLLPAPVGPYLANGSVSLGFFSFPSFYLVYLVETALILTFFLFVTKKLRTQTPPSSQQDRQQAQPGFTAPAHPVAAAYPAAPQFPMYRFQN